MFRPPLLTLARLVPLVAMVAGVSPGTAPQFQGAFEEVTVRLVLVHATVLNDRGESVTGLTPEDFVVREEGEVREMTVFGDIRREPVRLAFLLDISGSMGLGDKLQRAREAIRSFVSDLRPEDEMGLLVFAEGDVVVAAPFTRNREAFLAALDSQEALGRTALHDALAYAPRLLAEARPGRKALILVTDGLDNASEMTNLEAIWAARRVQVPIFVVGFTDVAPSIRRRMRSPDGGRSFFNLLEAYAEETGGTLLPVFRPGEIALAVAVVQDRLRGQYLIGFKPAPGDGQNRFRRIQVETSQPGLTVLSRAGFYYRP